MEITLPERSRPIPGSFPTTERALREWLEQQGARRPAVRLDAIVAGAGELQTLLVPPRRRLQLLTQLSAAARPLLDELARRVAAQGLPLPAPTQRNQQYELALLDRLSRGFDAVVADERQRRLPSARRIAQAAQAAMALRGEILLACARTYRPPPTGFWQGAHALYHAAEAEAARRVRPIAGGTERRSTDDEYRRLLVFAAAETEALARSQLAPLHALLGTWAQRLRLQRGSIEVAADAIALTVDLEQPQPPAFRRPRGDEQPGALRTLPLDGVIDALAELQRRTPRDEAVVGRRDTLYRRSIAVLLDHFQARPTRATVREADGRTAAVALGLRDIEQRLRPPKPEPPEPDGADREPRADIGLSGSELALQTVGPEARLDERERQREEAAVGTAHAAETAETEASAVEWRIVDRSPDGFRLQRIAESPCRAVVGELLAVHEPAAAGDVWVVGVIQWLRVIDHERLEFGVRRIGRDAAATTVRAEGAGEPALVFPGSNGLCPPATVLVPAYTFSTGTVVDLQIDGETVPIRLKELAERTATFCRFAVSQAGGESASGG